MRNFKNANIWRDFQICINVPLIETFLVEDIPLSVSTFSLAEVTHKLTEYLNINDSVRSLKMANLSCFPIPGELFETSDGYLEPSQASGVESF